MSASYPGAAKSFSALNSGDVINDTDIEAAYDEIAAIETELVSTGLTNVLLVNAGIKFPATQAASSNKNTLDDYEEDVWTPVIGGSGGQSGQVYARQDGLYVKKGQDVTVYFAVQLSTKGTITGNLQLNGLPFPAHATFGGGACIGFSSLNTTWVSIFAEVAASASVASITGAAAAASGNFTALTTSDVAATTLFRGSMSYRAAA